MTTEDVSIAGDIQIDFLLAGVVGHDCDKEDHHLARDVKFLLMTVETLETGEYVKIAIPFEHTFFVDLLDGTLSDRVAADLVRFEGEIGRD